MLNEGGGSCAKLVFAEPTFVCTVARGCILQHMLIEGGGPCAKLVIVERTLVCTVAPTLVCTVAPTLVCTVAPSDEVLHLFEGAALCIILSSENIICVHVVL